MRAVPHFDRVASGDYLQCLVARPYRYSQNAMTTFLYAAILSGVRSRSIQLLFGLALATLGCAWLASNFSARNPTTLAMDVGISALHFIVVVMTLFWVQDLMAKDIERKSVLFLLAYPRPRSSYVLGQFLAVAVLAALAVVIIGGLLWLLLWLGPPDYRQATPVQLGWPYGLNLLYLYLGVLVVAAFAVMIATLSTTPMLPLVLGLAFSIAASAIGPTYDFLQTSVYAEEANEAELSRVLKGAMWLLPDLSRLDIRQWPLYGKAPTETVLWGGVCTAIGYIALMLGIGMARFQRREFC